MEKHFYDQAIDWDIKRCKEMEGEDYTTRFLLDYECIKNNYRLIAVV